MSGLFGLTSGRHLDGHLQAYLQAMQDKAALHTALGKDIIYSDARLAASRVAPAWQLAQTPAFLPKNQQANATESIAVWFDGELYDTGNLLELLKPILPQQPSTLSRSQLLALAYAKTGDFKFLTELDGKFCAVVYNLSQNQIHLVSDRYGMCPLYWTVWNGSLIWCGNLRALTGIPGWTAKIDRTSVEDFLGMRYLMGDRTWFEDVELLSAATVVSWNLDSKTLKRHCYWQWNQIKPLPSNINIAEAAQEAGRLFVEGVKRQYQAGGGLFLTLSGGLDSRAIFAALPEVDRPILAITFGKENDPEVKLAKKISQKRATEHRCLETKLADWLIPQALQTGVTECLVPVNQLIFMPTLPLLQSLECYKVNLHGAGGDGLVGCKHFFLPDYLPKYLNRHLMLDTLARSPQHHHLVRERFYAYYKHLDQSPHQLYINHRIRRFSAKDFNLYKLYGIETRLPFLDYKFQEFLYALPSDLRLQPNEFYSWLLLQTFPKFYLGVSPHIVKNINPRHPRVLWDRVWNKAQRTLPWLKSWQLNRSPEEPSPFLTEPNLSFFRRLFEAVSPYFAEFVDPVIVRQDWEAHLRGNPNQIRLYDIAALELWLRSLDLGTGLLPI